MKVQGGRVYPRYLDQFVTASLLPWNSIAQSHQSGATLKRGHSKLIRTAFLCNSRVRATADRRQSPDYSLLSWSSRLIRSLTPPSTVVPERIGWCRVPDVGGAGGAVSVWTLW